MSEGTTPMRFAIYKTPCMVGACTVVCMPDPLREEWCVKLPVTLKVEVDNVNVPLVSSLSTDEEKSVQWKLEPEYSELLSKKYSRGWRLLECNKVAWVLSRSPDADVNLDHMVSRKTGLCASTKMEGVMH